nr:Type II secretory pathway, pseudopilin PulG [uncultured Haemophilus sp.]
MWRAFTLIEILITLSILIISILFVSPVLFSLQDRWALESEIENITSFIYQIQTKARFQKKNYSLTIAQNNDEKKWCIIAIQKESTKQVTCNCLNINSCVINGEYHLYQNQHQNIVLKNKSLFPKSFISIDGNAGRLESKCINISINKESEVLQFDQWGRIYVSPKNKRTTCRD